jgi:hypothetical protein
VALHLAAATQRTSAAGSLGRRAPLLRNKLRAGLSYDMCVWVWEDVCTRKKTALGCAVRLWGSAPMGQGGRAREGVQVFRGGGGCAQPRGLGAGSTPCTYLLVRPFATNTSGPVQKIYPIGVGQKRR